MAGLNQLLKRPRVGGKVLFDREKLAENQDNVIDYVRIPTYVLPFDYATGGGIPCNVTTQFYGPFMSGKTSLSYMAAKGLSHTCLRCFQPVGKCKCAVKAFIKTCPTCGKPFGECSHKSDPVELCETCGKTRLECTCKSRLIQKTFLCHLEGMPPDDLYFETLGYDPSNLVIGLPEYGEQACEMIEAAIKSDDCGLVIVDSIAGIVPREELECAYEDAKVAMQARLIARLFRRISPILVQEYRRGHLLGVIFINQVRSNIGGGRFDPGETTPGGWAAKHGHRLSVRINQLSVDASTGEKDKADGMKNVARFSCSMLGSESKQQMLILAGKAEYKIVLRDWEGYQSGSVLDANTCITLAKENGFLAKSNGIYEFKGTAVRARVLSDIEQIFKTNEFVNPKTGEVTSGAADILRFMTVRYAKYNAIKDIIARNRKITQVKNPQQAQPTTPAEQAVQPETEATQASQPESHGDEQSEE